MKITIQIIIDDEDQKIVKEVAHFGRQELSGETLGLTLKESKIITSGIQKIMTTYQVSHYTHRQLPCPCCGQLRTIK